MRIGLMGGSFDPPHSGHLHISLEAIKRLKLDKIWWLVSPGNPLKEQGPWPLEERLRQCVDLVNHPKIEITALEAAINTPYSAQTLGYLTRRFPTTGFVWIMGGDNLANIHKWRNWQQIFGTVAIAVFDRPGMRYEASFSKAAKLFSKNRIKERGAAFLVSHKPPAWVMLSVPLSFESSTRIRDKYTQ